MSPRLRRARRADVEPPLMQLPTARHDPLPSARQPEPNHATHREGVVVD